ncbi:MAG: hypothetical protein J2P41_24200, partial [Blastocatellia bacterium]|nr:hypothetical protein [Blastocatellia bacterium]
EDMAGYLDGKGKPMLYLADFGDNSRKRDDLTIYRVREPALPKGLLSKAPESVFNGATEPADAFPFKYPDGHHDAEALFVDRKTERPYIITKSMTASGGVYRFPLPLRTQEEVTLEKVRGSAAERISKLLLVTGAASSPDGNRVVVMTYFSAYEMIRAKGSFESIFDSELTPIRLPLQRQGEAISYTLDGKSIVTTGEQIPAPIYKLTRK